MPVSFDEDTASQPLSERVDPNLPPEELIILANNLEPELAGHSPPRACCGSFLDERPLEYQVLMREVDQSDEYFECRIEVETKDVRPAMLK
jgi:hypothetical protein